MPVMKKAGSFLKERGYEEVSFDTKAFSEHFMKYVEDEFEKRGADGMVFLQKARLRTAPEELKKLGFVPQEHEDFANYIHDEMVMWKGVYRTIPVDDQYIDAALALVKMYDYKVEWHKFKDAWAVRLT